LGFPSLQKKLGFGYNFDQSQIFHFRQKIAILRMISENFTKMLQKFVLFSFENGVKRIRKYINRQLFSKDWPAFLAFW
jgi:hypothetical protein